MRNSLIAIVLLLTGMTFYSALWFKSDVIQNDIATRVTEELRKTDAQPIEINVDGRHVALSGLVADEVSKSRLLAAADGTYGALGPYDGLNVRPDGGYLNVIKSEAGVTLQGTVPNEATRAALLAEAATVTDGDVTDQLSVAGNKAAWQDDAQFGLAQFASLAAGTLTASERGITITGVAASDAPELPADLSDRPGWNAFITRPTMTEGNDRSAEIAALTADVASRDTTIGTLEASLAAREAETSTLTDRITALEAELSNRPELPVSDSQQVLALQAQLDQQDVDIAFSRTEIDRLTGELAQRDQNIADLRTQVAGLESNVSALSSAIAVRELTIENLQSQINTATDAPVDDAQLNALTQTIEERDATIASLTADIAARDDVISNLEQDREASASALSAAQAAAAAAAAAVTEPDGQIAALTSAIAERDATIATLRNEASSRAAAATPVANTGTTNLAAQCTERANAILNETQINFRIATARLDQRSQATLERLTGIALACISDGLRLEIGGHTDDEGTDEDNQILSEARARTVLEFMTERGVDETGLTAVGYGESQPIADNATVAGRAANRRISFDWQPR